MNQRDMQPTYFMKGCNPVVQLARQWRIDDLYAMDGRHNPEHPAHSTYTGLWAQYVGEPCKDEDVAA